MSSPSLCVPIWFCCPLVTLDTAQGSLHTAAQDIPGHSRGFLPIECGYDEADDCIVFCTAKPDKSQIYGDPDGKTYGVLHKLFAEMAGLFDDDVFNIGADETSAKGPCSVNSSFSIERKIVDAIATDYKKTPEGCACPSD